VSTPDRNPGRRFRLWLEGLEDRPTPAVFTVTNTADGGVHSLRQAILDSNATPGTDSIDLNIPGGGVHVIPTASALPTITDPVNLDATISASVRVARAQL
jgi:hypothetical protein